MKKLLLTVLALSVIIINPNSFAYASWPSSHPAGAFYASIELFEDIEIFEYKFDFYIWEEFGECWVEIVPISAGITIFAGSFTVIQGGIQNSALRFETINGGPPSLSYYIPTVLKIEYLPYMSPYEIDLSKPFTLIYDLGGGDLVTMNVPVLMGGTTPDPEPPPLNPLTKTQVSQLYVSIFGRASEGDGNAYWQTHHDMTTAANAMLDTPAAKDYFGANLNTNQAFIEHIYLNTLNKTISDDFDGIGYWVNMLNAGTSRGQAVATLVGAINDYAPDGPYYDPNDAPTVAAYNQFINRVEVSNYMADNVYATPDDWETSTSFSHGMLVTDDPATVFAAMTIVNDFTLGPCGAYVAPNVWQQFDCYNLAAIGKTTGDDPFTPSWRLNGGYWQWGRKGPDPSQWYDTNTPNFAHGPTGPGSGGANSGEIGGWDSSDAPDGSWSDATKTANDPCPAGYRVPTKNHWEGVLDNNTQNTVGTWSSSATNYSAARNFGSDLMLSAAGGRYRYSGALDIRGYLGHYWSSSEGGSGRAWRLTFRSGLAYTYVSHDRLYGFSVRCIAE